MSSWQSRTSVIFHLRSESKPVITSSRLPRRAKKRRRDRRARHRSAPPAHGALYPRRSAATEAPTRRDSDSGALRGLCRLLRPGDRGRARAQRRSGSPIARTGEFAGNSWPPFRPWALRPSGKSRPSSWSGKLKGKLNPSPRRADRWTPAANGLPGMDSAPILGRALGPRDGADRRWQRCYLPSPATAPPADV